MNRAIITGATGVLGTALINELIKNKVEILVFCRKESKRNNQIPKNSLVKCINYTLEELSKINNETGKEYDVFYHFAWDGTIGTERNDIYKQHQNIKYSLDAVDLATRFGCKVFIGAGSQAEYGRFEGLLKPDTPTFPETGYGIAKLCAGQMTKEYANQLGIKHIWVRIVSTYGPNDYDKTLVMNVINTLRENKVPLCTKGEQIWDYLYSKDAAKAFYLLGDSGKNEKVYVLGSGNAFPLKKFVEIIRDIVSPNSDIQFGAIPYAKKQVMYLYADITELKKDISWQPNFDFYTGIKDFISHMGL